MASITVVQLPKASVTVAQIAKPSVTVYHKGEKGDPGDKATVAEINAGTVDNKYIAPLELAGSNYKQILVSLTEPESPTEGTLWIQPSE